MTGSNSFVSRVSEVVKLKFKKVILPRTNGSNENFFKTPGNTLVAEYEGRLIFLKYDFNMDTVHGILRTSNIAERSIGRFATHTFKTHSGTKYYYNDTPEKLSAEYIVKMELFNPECQKLLGIGKVLDIELA